MRTASAPVLSPHKLARLTAWARLWLVWFAAAFVALWNGGGRVHAGWLDRAARIAGLIIVLHATARLAPPRRARHRHGRVAGMRIRAMIGSRLRRAMRGGAAPERVFAILAVMRDLERHIALLMRRLRAGLTRLRVILPRAEAAPLSAPAPLARVACADTS